MTNDWNHVADVEAVRVDRTGDGQIQSGTHPIQVKLNLYKHQELIFDPEELEDDDEVEDLAEKYDPGEKIDDMYEGGCYVRLKYSYEDGVAGISTFKDASTPTDEGGWVGFDFLQALPIADGVVERIPGVENVTPATEVLGHHVDVGEKFELDQS